jgi:Ni,Fe-hydrogenase III large subunit
MCIEAARLVLLEAVERLPRAAAVHYDLAGLECQLGEVEVARGRLRHAFKLDPGLRCARWMMRTSRLIWDQL